MDVTTTIIGLSILVSCVLIFIVLGISIRKKEKNLLSALKAFAGQNNYVISQYDIWNHSAIAIDQINNVVFAVSLMNNKSTSFQVNLSEILLCRVLTARSTQSRDDSQFREIEKLDLAFSFRDKKKPDAIFTFYHYQDQLHPLSGELQLVEKWCRLVSERLAIPTVQ